MVKKLKQTNLTLNKKTIRKCLYIICTYVTVDSAVGWKNILPARSEPQARSSSSSALGEPCWPHCIPKKCMNVKQRAH